MKCPFCSQEIDDFIPFSFCPSCGQTVTVREPSRRPPEIRHLRASD